MVLALMPSVRSTGGVLPCALISYHFQAALGSARWLRLLHNQTPSFVPGPQQRLIVGRPGNLHRQVIFSSRETRSRIPINYGSRVGRRSLAPTESNHAMHCPKGAAFLSQFGLEILLAWSAAKLAEITGPGPSLQRSKTSRCNVGCQRHIRIFDIPKVRTPPKKLRSCKPRCGRLMAGAGQRVRMSVEAKQNKKLGEQRNIVGLLYVRAGSPYRACRHRRRGPKCQSSCLWRMQPFAHLLAVS